MTYAVNNLGTLPSFTVKSQAFGISNTGIAAGYANSAGSSAGFIGNNNGLSQIPNLYPDQTSSQLLCCDKNGVIYGGDIRRSSVAGALAILYKNGSVANVTIATDVHTQFVSSISPIGNAFSIMANGSFAFNSIGPAIPGGNSTQSYLHYSGTDYTLVPDGTLPAGSFMYLAACSNNGKVVGSSNNGGVSSTYRANLWIYNNPSPVQYSPFLGDNAAILTSISDDGNVVAGISWNSALLDYKPVVWTAGVAFNLGIPAGYLSGWINGMSANGQFVCGALTKATGETVAFVYNVTLGYVLLPSLVAAGVNSQSNAYSVSDDGVYVAGVSTDNTATILAAMWIGQKIVTVKQLQVPEPICMPCYTPCLAKNSIITKV